MFVPFGRPGPALPHPTYPTPPYPTYTLLLTPTYPNPALLCPTPPNRGGRGAGRVAGGGGGVVAAAPDPQYPTPTPTKLGSLRQMAMIRVEPSGPSGICFQGLASDLSLSAGASESRREENQA